GQPEEMVVVVSDDSAHDSDRLVHRRPLSAQAQCVAKLGSGVAPFQGRYRGESVDLIISVGGFHPVWIGNIILIAERVVTVSSFVTLIDGSGEPGIADIGQPVESVPTVIYVCEAGILNCVNPSHVPIDIIIIG